METRGERKWWDGQKGPTSQFNAHNDFNDSTRTNSGTLELQGLTKSIRIRFKIVIKPPQPCQVI